MNVLSQMLPGLREFRAPLTVGSLWALTGFLFLDRVPSAVQEGSLATKIQDVNNILPSAAVGSICALLIYLLGVVAIELGRIIFQFVLPVLKVGLPVALAILIAYILISSWVISILLVIVLAVVAFLQYRDQREVNYIDHLTYLISTLTTKFHKSIVEAWREVAEAWDPSREQVRYFLNSQIEQIFATTPTVLDDLVVELPVARLPRIAQAIGLKIDDLSLSQRIALGVSGTKMDAVLKHVNTDSGVADLVRASVLNNVRRSAAPRLVFFHTAVDVSQLRETVKNRLERSEVHLRADYETLYAEYDRIRAEGDFRIGVAPPVFTLGVVGGLMLIDDLQVQGGPVVWPFVISGIVAIILVVAGKKKLEESSRILYASLRQELVTQASPDVYGRGFLRLKAAMSPEPLATRILPIRLRRAFYAWHGATDYAGPLSIEDRKERTAGRALPTDVSSQDLPESD